MELLDRYGIKIGPVKLDQTVPKNDVIDIDFKDRDGKWVLRFRDKTRKFYQTRLGKLHNNMTQRAKGNYEKFTRAYDNIGMSELFSDPQAFCDWAVKQRGWGLGYQLDKDLLGGRHYSEENCVFLPKRINTVIAKTIAEPYETASGWGVNVLVDGVPCKFKSRTYDESKTFSSQVRAEYLRVLADSYRLALDPRAYEALISWTSKIK